MNNSITDYQSVIAELIKKQMVILGPDITLAKVKNVSGIQISNEGTVVSVQGDPKEILQKLIDSFVELSGLIVKKTMESILPGSSSMLSTPQHPGSAISAEKTINTDGMRLEELKTYQSPVSTLKLSQKISPSAIHEDKNLGDVSDVGEGGEVHKDEVEGKSANAHQSAIDEALSSLGDVINAQSGQSMQSFTTEKDLSPDDNRTHREPIQASVLPTNNANVSSFDNNQAATMDHFNSLKNVQGGI